ncbi:MAG: MoxR family ATPase [Eubacteriaceae bacterium]|nr:MoxR family ATPase [Eubacteriaceae bacterium]
MNDKIELIKKEIGKAIVGKDAIVEKVLTAMLADGHVLLEDIPGVGKTTLALAFSKAMGMKFNRVQFTPDVVPSDITGFSMYNKETQKFEYVAGAVMCNFFLADEINRTSSKTQSALLEVMQEGRVTVDGETHQLPQPFIVMATQNPLGTAGTQPLPEAQLDRFMIKLSMGYPDFQAQIDILKDREIVDPLTTINEVVTGEEVMEMKDKVKSVYVDDKIYTYITTLVEATRNHPLIRLGVSPRGALALRNMAKAKAFVEGRDYVVPEDISELFDDICRHRLILHPKAALSNSGADEILNEILEANKAPKID